MQKTIGPTLGPQHNVRMDNRENSVFTGVLDVESFDEHQVVMLTAQGTLVLTGKGLHIGRLDLEAGEVHVEGLIAALEYEDSVPLAKPGFFSRILR